MRPSTFSQEFPGDLRARFDALSYDKTPMSLVSDLDQNVKIRTTPRWEKIGHILDESSESTYEAEEIPMNEKAEKG